MRVDIENQPAFCCTHSVGVCVQRINARVLQLHERWEFSFLRGLGDVAVRFRSEGVQDEHTHFNTGHIGLDRSELTD